jgi:alpha-L-fucosidase
VPLRRGQWGWSPNEEHLVKPVTELLDIYYKSVGRNCNLLINATPDADGLIPDADMRRYQEFGADIRRRFGRSLAETSGKGTLLELRLRSSATIDHAVIMEEIASGERIREYTLEGKVDGAWKPVCSGQSVGHKRIEQFAPAAVSAVRLRIGKSIAEPLIRRLAVFGTRG